MSRIARLELMISQEPSDASKSHSNSTADNHTESMAGLSEAEKTFKIVFYCFLFVLGSLGNFLVIVVVKGKAKRTINDCFIFNLAVSDLTFLWLSLPVYTYELFKPLHKNVFYCKVIWPMMSVTLSVSVFTLTSMAIERCRGILHPLRPRIKLQTTLVWIALIWLCALLTMVPLMVVAQSGGTMCGEDWPKTFYRQTYTAALFGLQYAVPLMIIAVAYIRIAIGLLKSRKPMRTSINRRGQVVRHKTKTENFQIIKTIAVIVLLFMACMLPNQIAWMLFDFGGDTHKELSHGFWAFAEALIYLHACVNPIAYGSLTRQFRRGYVHYMSYILRCGRSPLDSEEMSGNLTSERPPRPKCTAVIFHGSIRCTSIIERSRTIAYNEQPSPNSGQSRLLRSNSPSKSSFREATSIEMLLRASDENVLSSQTFLNLSFTNSAFSDDDESCQDTKL